MNEKIQHLKNELKSYKYYISKLTELKKELERIEYKLDGVSGIDPSKIKVNSFKLNRENFFELMETEKDLNIQIRNLSKNIRVLDELIEWVDKPYDEVLKEIYINKSKSYLKLIEELDINYSERQLKRIINNQIKTYIKAFRI